MGKEEGKERCNGNLRVKTKGGKKRRCLLFVSPKIKFDWHLPEIQNSSLERRMFRFTPYFIISFPPTERFLILQTRKTVRQSL